MAENSIDIPIAKQEEVIISNFMIECFHKVAIKEGFKDYNYHVNTGSNIGDGYVGNILKIEIKENGTDAKSLSLLLKVPLSNKARRETMKMMNLFQREILVYNVILPKFMMMQKEKNVSDTLQFCNFPKVYCAEFNKEVDEAIIIMEDLRGTGHKMWNKSMPINFDHAKLLMTTLGRLHGLSFVLRTKHSDEFKLIQDINDDFSDVLQTPQFEVLLKGSVTRLLDFLKPEEAELKEKLLNLVENLKDITIESVKPKYVEPYAVLLHGDCWINNYLFHYTDYSTPDDIKLIDWQITRYGSPAIDLIYFFLICTDKKMRSKHFDELIKIYYDSLKEMLKHFSCDASELFPFEVLQEHLRKFGKFGVIMAGFILPALLAKSEQIVDLDYVMENTEEMSDMAEHVVDNMVERDIFAERILGVLRDAISNGYL